MPVFRRKLCFGLAFTLFFIATVLLCTSIQSKSVFITPDLVFQDPIDKPSKSERLFEQELYDFTSTPILKLLTEIPRQAKAKSITQKAFIKPRKKLQTMKPTLTTTELAIDHIPVFTCLRPNPPVLNYHLCVYDREVDSYISASVLSMGQWEGGLAYAITEALKTHPNSGFIDLGAYIGTHTLFVANKGYQVVSVEPFEDNLFLLNRSIDLNSMTKVKVIPRCLSNAEKTQLFIRPENNPGNSKFLTQNDPITLQKYKLKCTSLNSLLPQIAFKKAVIKVDIEGSEVRVFQEKSAAKFFEKIEVPVVFMEWGSLLKTAKETDISQLVQFFISRSFEPFVMVKSGLRTLLKDPWNQWPWDIVWLVNGSKNNFAKTWKP